MQRRERMLEGEGTRVRIDAWGVSVELYAVSSVRMRFVGVREEEVDEEARLEDDMFDYVCRCDGEVGARSAGIEVVKPATALIKGDLIGFVTRNSFDVVSCCILL
jgi:hypothetical protein